MIPADELTEEEYQKAHRALIIAACEAEELFTLDELEEYARKVQAQKERR